MLPANFSTSGSQNAISVTVASTQATVVWDSRVTPSDTVSVVGVADVSSSSSSVTTTNSVVPTFTAVGTQTVGALGSDSIAVTFTGPRVIESEAEDLSNWQLRVNGTTMDLTNAIFTLNTTTQIMSVDLPVTANLHASFTLAALDLSSVAGIDLASTAVAGAATGDLTVPTLVGGTASQNLTESEFGTVIDFTFSESVDPVFAAQTSNFTPPFPIFTSSVSLPADNVLRVTFTSPVIPGTNTVAVSGVVDAHGNAFAGGTIVVAAGSTVANDFTTTPVLTTVANVGGDTLVADFVQAFDSDSAEDPDNWSLVVDAVTIDLSTQTLVYDFASKRLTISLTDDFDNGDAFTFKEAVAQQALDVDGQSFASTAVSAVAGETTKPTVTLVTQNRSVDVTGQTIDVAMSEDVDSMAAELTGSWTVTGGLTVSSASVLTSQNVVRLVLDDVAVPGSVTVSATAVTDLAGNTMDAAAGIAVGTTDSTAPAPTLASASAIEGVDNDTLTVIFNDKMIASDVTTASNWTVESPVGTSITEADTTIAYNAVSNTATMTFGSVSGVNLRTGDDFNVTFTGLRDISANTVTSAVLVGNVSAESTLPVLESVYLDSGVSSQVHVRFSEPVDELDDLFDASTNPTGLTTYTLRDSGGSVRGTPLSVAIDTDKLGGSLTFGFVVVTTDTLDVSGIIDLAGNAMFSESLHPILAEESGTPILDTGVADFTVTSGEENDLISIVFDRPMSSWEILDPANYDFKLGASPIDISTSPFSFDGDKTVSVNLDTSSAPDLASASTYDLTITGLMSRQGVPISTSTAGSLTAKAGSDTTDPGLVANSVRIDAANDTTAVLIVMDEALDPTDAVDETIITLNGVNPSAAVQVGPRTVRATFPSVTIGHTLVTTIADLAGNAGTVMLALVAKETNVPLLDTVAGISRSGFGSDEITVTFDEPVDPALALSVNSYTVTQSGASVSLAGASLSLDSNNDRVHIKLAASIDLDVALGVTVVVNSVTDVSGNAVTPGSNLSGIVTGDTTAPAFADSFVNLRANASGLVVDVEFTEDVMASFAGNVANYSADGGQTVSAVSILRSNVIRLTLSAPMASGDKIETTGLVDPAGNTASAISTIPVL
ncbi:MAG: hypothetical protein ACI8TQ_002285 [Planctomycetota bacterium]|jgi:hypothetical protein